MTEEFEKGEEVFLVRDDPSTPGTFDRYDVEFGDVVEITHHCEDAEFDWWIEYDENRELKISEREISHTYCENHGELVHYDKTGEWVCPWCDL